MDFFFPQFISGDVYGVMCWTFCDFGKAFEVVDTDGEEPKDAFISSITKVRIMPLSIYIILESKHYIYFMQYRQ